MDCPVMFPPSRTYILEGFGWVREAKKSRWTRNIWCNKIKSAPRDWEDVYLLWCLRVFDLYTETITRPRFPSFFFFLLILIGWGISSPCTLFAVFARWTQGNVLNGPIVVSNDDWFSFARDFCTQELHSSPQTQLTPQWIFGRLPLLTC